MAYQAVFKRYELKYLLTPEQKEHVLRAMEPHMQLDKYGDSMYFVWRQLAFLAVGFAAMFVASWIEPSVYEKYTPLFFGIVCLLLVAVLPLTDSFS